MDTSVKRKIVSAITIFRMALVLLLPAMLLITPSESEKVCVPFWVLYLLGGLSDVADGLLARRWQVQSERGAKMDTWADALFILGTVIYLGGALEIENYSAGKTFLFTLFVGIGIGVIALIRFISMAVCEERFGKFTGIHTIANKMAGVMLFLTVPVGLLGISFGRLGYCILSFWAVVLWIVCGFASVEEMIIVFKMKTLDVNRKSIFHKRKSEEKGE